MVSLSNHEGTAQRHGRAASWFDKLTMKRFWYQTSLSEASKVIRHANAQAAPGMTDNT